MLSRLRGAARLAAACGSCPARAVGAELGSSSRSSSTSVARAPWAHTSASAVDEERKAAAAWRSLLDQGHTINPCQSRHHPAVKAGLSKPADDPKSLQQAYTPESTCPGCGPACADHGLHLRSFRSDDGLVADLTFPDKFCCFPGVVSGGTISTALDCHGNWTAAVELMDNGCLPLPPLTVTYAMSVTFAEPTPPETPLIVRSKVTKITRSGASGSRATVEVDLALCEPQPHGKEKELVRATGIYKRSGALRAL